jgi:hypothetical protein
VTFDAPSRLTAIPDASFHGCSDLATLDLPDSVASIASFSFEGISITGSA